MAPRLTRFLLMVALLPALALPLARGLGAGYQQRFEAETGSSLTEACRQSPALAGPVSCGDFQLTGQLALVSAVALVAVLALLLWLRRLPAAENATPEMLRQRLQFGLKATTGLVILRGAVLVMAIAAAAQYFGGRAPAAIIALVGMQLAFRLVPLNAAMTELRQRCQREFLGGEPPAAAAVLLGGALGTAGTTARPRIVLGNVPALWLHCDVSRNLHDDGLHSGQTLYLCAGALRLLRREELAALLRWEFSRLAADRGAALAQARDWLDLRRRALEELRHLRYTRQLGSAALPALAFADLFLDRADQALARAPGQAAAARRSWLEAGARPQDLAAGLLKLALLREFWERGFRPALNVRMSSGRDPRNLSLAFAQAARELPDLPQRARRALAALEELALTEAQREQALAAAADLETGCDWFAFEGQTEFEERISAWEKDWMVRTGRASTPTDSWELRGAA